MVGEAIAMVKLMSWLLPSMTYSRYISSSTRPGILRLLTLIPVMVPLPFLPLCFSTLHLRNFAFFLIWLAIFKLLLLSFDAGPLSPFLPLPTFLAISSLPLVFRIPRTDKFKSPGPLLVPFAIKLIIFFLLIFSYRYDIPPLHPFLLTIVNCLHLYLTLDLILTSTALLVGILFGLKVGAPFAAPLISSSLQDFWGRRWNLAVTGILRSSVFDPVRSRYGIVAGYLATFGVSGLMHEIMFYYLTWALPTGEVTCFFILHGICTAMEVSLRRKGWRTPHPLVGTMMTLGFIAVTAMWLLFPPMLRTGADRVVVEECMAVVRFFEDPGRSAFRRLFG